MNPVSIPELWQDNKANTHTHLLDLSEQFSGSAFQTLMERRSGDQINRNFHWQACEVCFPQPFVQRPHRAGFRLRDCSLSMKCNSRNRKLEHIQGRLLYHCFPSSPPIFPGCDNFLCCAGWSCHGTTLVTPCSPITTEAAGKTGSSTRGYLSTDTHMLLTNPLP